MPRARRNCRAGREGGTCLPPGTEGPRYSVAYTGAQRMPSPPPRRRCRRPPLLLTLAASLLPAAARAEWKLMLRQTGPVPDPVAPTWATVSI